MAYEGERRGGDQTQTQFRADETLWALGEEEFRAAISGCFAPIGAVKAIATMAWALQKARQLTSRQMQAEPSSSNYLAAWRYD